MGYLDWLDYHYKDEVAECSNASQIVQRGDVLKKMSNGAFTRVSR